MKKNLIIILLFAFILIAAKKPWKTARRMVVLTVVDGKRTVTPLSGWEEYEPKQDTVYEYKVY